MTLGCRGPNRDPHSRAAPMTSEKPNGIDASTTTPAGIPGARLALTLLLLINLFNYIDRQVLAALEPNIRAEFFPNRENPETKKLEEPREAKFWTGLLPTAFLVTYMLTAPVFGWLSNRMARWVLVGI